MQTSPQSVLEHFYHLAKKPVPFSSHLQAPCTPSPKQPLTYFLSLGDSPTQSISYKWNPALCDLCVWLLSLGIEAHPRRSMCHVSNFIPLMTE